MPRDTEELAADGENVPQPVEAPTEDELVAYLAEHGWTEVGMPDG